MRIVIAGGGYFARLLACHICRTPHSVVVLSETVSLVLGTRNLSNKTPPRTDPSQDQSADFEPLGCQSLVVSFSDPAGLLYAFRGANLVISTLSTRRRREQVRLVEAARRTASVRRFIPSGFEGRLSLEREGGSGDGGDSDRDGAVLKVLEECGLPFTVFSCGLFYERLGPGGIGAYGCDDEGPFLVDVAAGTADVVERDGDGRRIAVCMSSMDDAARFVAAAVEMADVDHQGGLGTWPRELRARGDHLSVRAIMDVCQEISGSESGGNALVCGGRLRGSPTDWPADTLIVTRRRYQDLRTHLAHMRDEDSRARRHARRLLALADGRYSFRPTLNELVDASGAVDVRPMGFSAWMMRAWAGRGTFCGCRRRAAWPRAASARRPCP
jgi:hypothetical protein